MKQIVNFSISLLFTFLFFSCTQADGDGDWDDNIKLSGKVFEFNATGDSITVTTGGTWWWLNAVRVNGSHFCDFGSVNLEADQYKIKQDCFVVERRNTNTLFIKVVPNTQCTKRTVVVCLQDGDYYDFVTITQKAK